MIVSNDYNKVKYGLRNVHYAQITETDGVVTYGKPKKLPGAVSLSLDAKGDTFESYADDTLYVSGMANQGYSGELEIAMVTDEFRIDVLGHTFDDNGVLMENKDGVFRDIALLFEFDGDKNKTRHVLYKVTPSRPKIESSTHTASKEVKTDALPIVVSPAFDTGDIRAKVSSNDVPYAAWYTEVYTRNKPIVPPTEPDKPEGGETV